MGRHFLFYKEALLYQMQYLGHLVVKKENHIKTKKNSTCSTIMYYITYIICNIMNEEMMTGF